MKRRCYNGSMTAYAGSSYAFQTTPAAGGIIKAQQGNAVIQPLNAVKPIDGLPTAQAGAVIPQAFDNDKLTKVVNDLSSMTTTTSSPGCAASCSGLCHAQCSTTCRAGCAGCSAACFSSCEEGCTSTCKELCGDTCKSACAIICTSCTNTCKGSCTSCDGCHGTCHGLSSHKDCGGNCSGTCNSSCGACTSCSGVYVVS